MYRANTRAARTKRSCATLSEKMRGGYHKREGLETFFFIDRDMTPNASFEKQNHGGKGEGQARGRGLRGTKLGVPIVAQR